MNTFRSQGELNFNFDETLEAAKISPFGFREYDARWLYPQEINKKGLELFGFGLGKFIVDKKALEHLLLLDTTTAHTVKKLNTILLRDCLLQE